MALSNATVFEVRTTGSDNNGGGFVTGSGGTDYSQQTAAQQNFNGTTITASDVSIGSTLTLAGVTADATWVGNLLNITGGTNFTVGVYQILSQTGSTITLDRNATTAAGAAMTGNMGGCFATIGKAVGLMSVTGMITYVKATATYSISTGIATVSGINTALGVNRIIGYTTTRGDLGRPTIQTTAAVNAYTDANGGHRLENFIVDNNSVGSLGVSLSGNYSSIFNCTVKNTTGNGVNIAGISSGAVQCEITNTANQFIGGTGAYFLGCWFHAINNSNGVIYNSGTATVIEDCIFDSNPGVSTDCINVVSLPASVRRCVFYNTGRTGISNASAHSLHGEISNNIFVSNGGYGINWSVASPVRDDVNIHHNAFYNNTSGARNGLNAGTGDVTLTGDPFIASGSANFALNNTAGQGAACRIAGYPGVMIGGGTGYHDIGALQARPSNFVHPGMAGGMRG